MGSEHKKEWIKTEQHETAQQCLTALFQARRQGSCNCDPLVMHAVSKTVLEIWKAILKSQRPVGGTIQLPNLTQNIGLSFSNI